MTTTLHRTTHATPVGHLTVVAGSNGLRAVLWPDDSPGRVPLDRGSGTPEEESGARHDPADVLSHTVEQLDEYFAGDRTTFDLPLAPFGTAFQISAWAVLRTIPFGATMTYGQQAIALGDARKARAVGAANGRNPLSIVVPCHRVTGSGGKLTGFAGGLGAKSWLLDHERNVLAALPVDEGALDSVRRNRIARTSGEGPDHRRSV